MSQLTLAYWFVSMTEIQNARGIMDVLAEMLNALDPGNKEVSWHIPCRWDFELWNKFTLVEGCWCSYSFCYTFLRTYHYCIEWLKNLLRWPSQEFSWINHTVVLIEFKWTWSNAPEFRKTKLCPKGVYLTTSFWKNTFFPYNWFFLEMTFLAIDFVLKPSQIGFYLKMLLILFSCFGLTRLWLSF